MKQWTRLTALALLAPGVWACSSGDAVEVGIQSVEVTRGNLRITAEAVGSIEPVRSVEVKSKASGEILRLHADIGDFVMPGALLAEVDPRDVRNRYDQSQADLDVSQAQANNAQSQLERSLELHAAGVITDQELESNRLSFTNAQANLTRARTNHELAELQLEDVTIRAPMAGTILSKTVEEGSVIQSAAQNVSGGTALFVMASLDQMQVRALIDETDIGELSAGLPATIRVQAYPSERFDGVVQQIEPQAVVQQSVTRFPVIVTLDNRDGLLKPGMNAEVEILIDEASDILLVANTAMVTPQDALAAARAFGLDDSAVDPAQLNAAGRGGAQAAAGGAAARAGAGGAAAGGRAAGGRMGGGGGGGRGGGGGGQAFQGRGGGAAAGPGSTGRSVRPMVVFVVDAAGALQPRMIQIGLNDWDRTEVVSGLEGGERVALVGAAQLQAQQQAMMNRMGGGGLNSLLGGAMPGGGRGGGGGGGGRGF